MKNFISPSNHVESKFTGSTVESMVDKTKSLDVDYFSCTDHGSMNSILKAYQYCNKKKMKIIAGIEIFFRDDDCDIIRDTESAEIKYFKLLIHFKDQEAYQLLVKMISDTKRKAVIVNGEDHKLFDWSDLFEISHKNTSICTSDIEGMVSKHLLVNRPDLSVKYYNKLKEMFGGNFFPTLIPRIQDKYWNSIVELNLNGKLVKIPAGDRVETNIGSKHKAMELTYRNTKHKELKAVVIGGVRHVVSEQYRNITKATLSKDFQDLPEDLQTKANKLIRALANKNGDTLLISGYSYYSNEDDFVVQNMKLGEELRIHQRQNIKSSEETVEYFHKEMNIDLFEIEKMVENSYKWASNFDDFKLEYGIKFVDSGENPEQQMLDIIKKVGRMKWDNPVWVKQFREEFDLLTKNGIVNLVPYFIPLIEIFDHYKENGQLVGPGRGSSSGFLLSYLMGITQIDPIKYKLYSSRFLTQGRVEQNKLPDIDCDMENRELLVGTDGNGGYLKEKYGDRAAQCSTRTLLRLKSAILDANRFINKGTLEQEVQALSKSLPMTPMGITDNDFVFGYELDGNHEVGLLDLNKDLKEYVEKRPEEWNIVVKALSLGRQIGRHACFSADTMVVTVDNSGNRVKKKIIDCDGEIIVTHKGNQAKAKLLFQGKREVFRYTFSDGSYEKCTSDHKFLTKEDGWVEIQYIYSNILRQDKKNVFVKSIKRVGVIDVYDLSVDHQDHSFLLSNGILAHNCAYTIADRPIEDIVPVIEVGGVKRVTGPEHSHCEVAGLQKYDFLNVLSVKDVRICLDYINKKNNETDMETGYFTHNGVKTYIWDLPEDQGVFDMLGRGETETIFQLNTVSVTPVVKKVKPSSIIDCATVTSLVRPGPLGFIDEKTGRNMVEEYIERKFGRSQPDIPILKSLIPETHAILVFQEQVVLIARELGGMNVEDSENLRIAMGKKKIKLLTSLKPMFMEGALKKVDKETADKIWNMLMAFASYGFCKAHAVAYSAISYACAFMKHRYPLEWWAAILTNAPSKEINEVFYKYTKDMVLPPDVNLSTEDIIIDYDKGKLRNKLSMITGLGVKVANRIMENRPYKDLNEFLTKKPCGPSLTKKLIYVGVLDSLFPVDFDLDQKMNDYEYNVNLIKYNAKLLEYDEKITTYTMSGDEKGIKRTQKNKEKYIEKGIKESEVDPSYMMLTSKKDFIMKKSVFPTINLDLEKALLSCSSVSILDAGRFKSIENNNGRYTNIFPSDLLQKIDENDVKQDIYFCTPAYIIEASEFTYKNGARKALKMILDSSGYVSEKVLWPDYESGELIYDPEIKKGAVIWVFYSKKTGKPYTNINQIIIEEKSIL